MKSCMGEYEVTIRKVAPVRERGLKLIWALHLWDANDNGRSREGAWIEINKRTQSINKMNVAPVRERGLKF